VSLYAPIAVLVVAFPLTVVAQETYVVDPVHSQPQYEARHIGMGSQHGNFGKMTGKITLDRAAKKGSAELTIDATSIRSNDPRLDAILKGERYFNVEKYPTLAFKSTNITFDGDRVIAIDGELTMLGLAKPVSFRVTHFNCGESPFNKRPMCGADATATIKRSDWGMTSGLQINNPSDEIRLMVPIEAYRE
jgi:polyisoprenoid-binding protein YceI